jgi:putative phage-type endonuclease
MDESYGNLINIIDTIVPDEDALILNEESKQEIIESTLTIMYDYINDNPTAICEPDFDETFTETVEELLYAQFENEILFNSSFEEELDKIIEEAFEIFYSTIIPERSFSETFIIETPNIKTIKKQINYLSSKPQPVQRTPEWYEFRHNLITASNAYKVFESQSSQNQLIYEKCHENNNSKQSSCVNINTPFHWGQKYEPVSVMIYENNYNTKIKDFGCIRHDKYSFLGASPDGINIDETNPRYGRMLEIKNIVNREIDGIPKKEYWIQMQLQMETCNLNECDFLETKFAEYENETDFLNDGEFNKSSNGELKGVIMYFNTQEGNPLYLYKPLNMDKDEFDLWEANNIDTMKLTWIKNIYWKLEIISCVLVLRNEKWFKDNIQSIQKIWSIIESERINGYDHRAPIKKNKIETVYGNDTIQGCFLNFNKIKQNNYQQQHPTINVIKIRTESIDETMNNL